MDETVSIPDEEPSVVQKEVKRPGVKAAINSRYAASLNVAIPPISVARRAEYAPTLATHQVTSELSTATTAWISAGSTQKASGTTAKDKHKESLNLLESITDCHIQKQLAAAVCMAHLCKKI